MLNRPTFGSVSLRKEELLHYIQQLDKEEARGCLSDEQRNARIKAKGEFQEVVIREEIKMASKSRINWLQW